MDKTRRGVLAKEILTNPLWEEVFDEMGKYYYEEFRASKDADERIKIGLANDMLDDFKATLVDAVVDGMTINVGDNT